MSETLTPTAIPELPEIVQRFAQGESVKQLAAECSVARQTIYRWMLSAVGDAQYHDLVTDALIARIAESDKELDESADNVTVTRAYAKARLSRQDFERRRPKLYGPKQEISTDKTVKVYVMRETPQPVVVEGQTVEALPVPTEDNQ